MLVLVSMSALSTEKPRSDKKVSRKFYTAVFADPSNPFAKKHQRNFFQDHLDEAGTVAGWKSGDPSIVAGFVGKQIPGEIVNCTVKPYQIGDRTVTSYSTVVLGNETLERVLKLNNKELVSAATADAKELENLNAN